jgi:hypothetical protein
MGGLFLDSRVGIRIRWRRGAAVGRDFRLTDVYGNVVKDILA